MMKPDDQVTDLCAAINTWDDMFTSGGDPVSLVAGAHDLLGRARYLLKEMLAEWPETDV
jgi:hypothetical protein